MLFSTASTSTPTYPPLPAPTPMRQHLKVCLTSRFTMPWFHISFGYRRCSESEAFSVVLLFLCLAIFPPIGISSFFFTYPDNSFCFSVPQLFLPFPQMLRERFLPAFCLRQSFPGIGFYHSGACTVEGFFCFLFFAMRFSSGRVPLRLRYGFD